MCGRIALFTPPARLARLLDAALGAGLEADFHASWNVAPTRPLYAVSELDEGRVLERYRWGLVPSWAKDPKISSNLFNARAETVAEKPSFRSAFKKRPCVIPVDGFYEWDHRPDRPRQPHYFSRTDGQPMLFAGLFEYWHDPAEKPEILSLASCTVITTTPSEDMDEIHDRMPVVLSHDDVETWLDVGEHSPDERLLLLRPAPAATLQHWGVDARVGSVKRDGPHLIEPLVPDRLF